MHLFLTSVLPFLAHDHASAVAFLTCRHHNFHASIIPEFLSDEERVRKFCESRQQNQEYVNRDGAYKNLYNLFVQTPLMQFSPSLVLRDEDCEESILKPLLETKYFTRTLQRCVVLISLSNDLLQNLSKVQSLTKLETGWCEVKTEHFETIINSFPSLKTFTIFSVDCLDPRIGISISSPPPPATKTLHSLTKTSVSAFFTTQFVPHFSNLRKLALSAKHPYQTLDLLPLLSSLPLLTDLSLTQFDLKNTESLKNCHYLSSIQFSDCDLSDFSFLALETCLPQLATLCIESCDGLPTSSLSSLSHASNLHVLHVVDDKFNNDCLQYLANMVHLQKLDLSSSDITGESRSLKTLMQNLFQLEELILEYCMGIGNQGVIAGALYSTHCRLRVLNLTRCNLVDDDLKRIDALKNTLEVLDLSDNTDLTNEGLVHCKDLVKLKKVKLNRCVGINDLSPLKDCLNLEDLDVWNCEGLTDDSFKVFSQEPNSFPNLCGLVMSECKQLSEKVFEHLVNNNNLVYQLKELNVEGMSKILLSAAARNNICQLKGLRRLRGVLSQTSWRGAISSEESEVMRELMKSLRNLEEIA